MDSNRKFVIITLWVNPGFVTQAVASIIARGCVCIGENNLFIDFHLIMSIWLGYFFNLR